MLGLFGNKSDHPLDNIKSAQEQLNLLNKTDAIVALQEITNWIEMLFDKASDFRPDHQFLILRLLDEAAQTYLHKTISQYFAVQPINSFQENRLWLAMNAYYTFVEQGYLHLLLAAREGEKKSSVYKEHEALICARGISALFGHLECVAVRGEHIPPQMWVNLADFFDYAAVQQLLHKELQLYNGQATNTTVARQFASVVACSSIGVGALRSLSIHIAKRLIAHISPAFSANVKIQHDSLFVFDLAKPVAPARVIDKNTAYPPSCCFVSMGETTPFLDSLLTTLSKNIVPADLHLGAAYDPEMIAEVVRRIALYGRGLLPVRRLPRRKIKMKINVLDGFFSMLDQTHVDLNLSEQTGEHWDVEDMSANGLRCVIEPSKAQQVKIGSLVGLQPEKSLHWGVGIIRRVNRDEKNNLHVGIRILANRVDSVELFDNSNTNDAGYRALLLDRPDEGGGETWLLLKSDLFNSNHSPMMKICGERFLMLPLKLEEKGDDFDLVCYRKMVKDNSNANEY
jgi:hypothetical protein